MARKRRFSIPGFPQLVIQRGNNRAACFFADEDRRFYLACLRDAARVCRCAVHAYVLMPDHAHLLLTPQGPADIPRFMQHIGRRFVQYVNKTHGRTGTLWEGRYRALLVGDDNKLLDCYRYVEFYPVRAGLAPSPADYRWSSYGCNALGDLDAIVTPHPAYLALGVNAGARRAAYTRLLCCDLDVTALHEVQQALQQELVLGSDCFKKEIEQTLSRRTRPGLRGRPRKRLEPAMASDGD
jgi:putative transposase